DVARMPVKLQYQAGLAAGIIEKRLDVGVRAAFEVRDINKVQAGNAPGDLCGGENQSARVPIHIVVDLRDIFAVERQKVQWQHINAVGRPQLARNVATYRPVVDVVGPAQQDDGRLARLAQYLQRGLPGSLHRVAKVLLRPVSVLHRG